MTIKQLKYFLMMAEVLHYTRASQLLHISQSSLSYSLSELENELGAPLFEKSGKKTVLTRYGIEFLPFVREALNSLDAGTKWIEKMLSPTTVISLGYIYSLSFNFLPLIITGFRGAFSQVETAFNFFQGFNSLLIEKLKRGELDLALSVDPHDDMLCSEPVYEQQLFLVVPRGHHLAQKKQVLLADLSTEDYVSISPHSSLRRHLDNIFSAKHIKPKIVFEAEECNAMASFVSESFGVAIMPEIPALHSFKVEILPIADAELSRSIHVLWAKNHPLPPEAAQFRDYLINRIK